MWDQLQSAGDEMEQRVQPVTAHLGQEMRGLGGGPHADGRLPALELPAPGQRVQTCGTPRAASPLPRPGIRTAGTPNRDP